MSSPVVQTATAVPLEELTLPCDPSVSELTTLPKTEEIKTQPIPTSLKTVSDSLARVEESLTKLCSREDLAVRFKARFNAIGKAISQCQTALKDKSVSLALLDPALRVWDTVKPFQAQISKESDRSRISAGKHEKSINAVKKKINACERRLGIDTLPQEERMRQGQEKLNHARRLVKLMEDGPKFKPLGKDFMSAAQSLDANVESFHRTLALELFRAHALILADRDTYNGILLLNTADKREPLQDDFFDQTCRSVRALYHALSGQSLYSTASKDSESDYKTACSSTSRLMGKYNWAHTHFNAVLSTQWGKSLKQASIISKFLEAGLFPQPVKTIRLGRPHSVSLSSLE